MDQALRLQDQYFDGETGVGYNPYRYFEPGIGAFISQSRWSFGYRGEFDGFAPDMWVWRDLNYLFLTRDHSQKWYELTAIFRI